MTDKPDAPAAETALPEAGIPARFLGPQLVRGRIVHYQPTSYEAKWSDPGPWAAIVTRVGDGGVCTLNLHLPEPVPVGGDPVCRKKDVPFSETPADGHWSWPPR